MRKGVILTAKANARDRGAAMIAVLCVMALLVCMGMALILGASSITSAARQKHLQEQCYQLAKSFSLALKSQLHADGHEEDRMLTMPKAKVGTSAVAGMISLTEELETSDEPKDAVLLSTKEGTGSAQFGEMTLLVRKAEYTQGSTGGNGASEFDCTIYVTVRAELSGSRYDYTSVYYRQRTLETQYFVDDKRIVQDNMGQWRYFVDNGVVPQENVNLKEIRYVYDPATVCYSLWYQYGGWNG